MRRKLLGMSLAGILVALAAWLVYRNDSLPETVSVPLAQAAQPQASQADKIPEKDGGAATKGLAYLVKHQFADGHWEGDGGKHPVAMTGLVGLALLMEQNKSERTDRGGVNPYMTPAKARYSVHIRKAADWLMDRSQPKRGGLIFSEHPSETARYMEGHGLATLFLAGVCRDESDKARAKKLTEILTRAVKYIARAQSSQGGWYHTSRVEGHDFAAISATAIQVQALQAAENAGIAIPGGAVDDALEYLKTAMGKYEKAKPEEKSSRLADTSAALVCRFNPFAMRRNGKVQEPKMTDEWCKNWLKYCQAEIPLGRTTKFGRDELVHYYYAQSLFNVGGDAWGAYRKAMFAHLQSSQNKDGSWPPGDGLSVGPVYSTAVWCIVLELEKDSHPSRSQLDLLLDITMRRIGTWAALFAGGLSETHVRSGQIYPANAPATTNALARWPDESGHYERACSLAG